MLFHTMQRNDTPASRNNKQTGDDAHAGEINHPPPHRNKLTDNKRMNERSNNMNNVKNNYDEMWRSHDERRELLEPKISR